ncbi:MAG: glycerate kinase [Bacteroidia bacterium]
MKILIAPDKFRGTLTANEAAKAMAEGVRRYNPDWEVRLLPIADGGEGTAEVLTLASGGTMVSARASDPYLRYVACEYGVSGDGTTAFIDMAAASGLHRLQASEVNAMKTSSLGTGQLIFHALNRKCSRIVLGLGGTATMDCGTGIAHALGISFLDELQRVVAPIGGNLGKIEFIDISKRFPALNKANFIVLADVALPLLGEEGAMLFADQKGITEADRARISGNLAHFANLMEASHGTVARTPGMGAAGGAALGCMGLLGAKLAFGADFVMEALQVPQAISEADLVITGEGMLDDQSLHGKAAIALSRAAQRQSKPVLAICGKISLAPEQQQEAGITMSGALVGELDGQLPEDSARELAIRTEEMLRELAPKLA